MSDAPAIPHELHVGLRPAVRDGLGAFWSSLFRDQPFLDALLASRTLSATQLQIDAREALLLRDHRNLPVFHREHWHPLFIRRSGRNRGRGLSIGMDSAVIGPQVATSVYLDGEVFVVGGNDEYSKVNTYPFETMNGCPLKRVLTCICDSISSPRHILVQGRDFDIAGNVLVVRKEQDPFESGGYRTVDDGTARYKDEDGNDRDDVVAVLWVCDGEYDTNNVADFLAYPMGFDVESSETSKRVLSAYWDAVVHGITPRYLNTMLGALYDVPTAVDDETVDAVSAEGDFTNIVTGERVYRIETGRVRPDIKAGSSLAAGEFLTDELTVYHSFSEGEFAGLVDSHVIDYVTLPAGSVGGLDVPVRVESRPSALEDGWWFKLSADDSADSPFWSRFSSDADRAACAAAFGRMAVGGTVDPLKTVGYAALANTVIVYTKRKLIDAGYVRTLFAALQRLMPGYSSLLTVDEVTGS